jgi:hypothetical protein
MLKISGFRAIRKSMCAISPSSIDGIYTRECVLIEENTKIRAKFLETSSPGLRGQSGGPIFDVRARVWALQSRTFNFPLGFSPQLKIGNTSVTEHQFLNVGIGSHVEEILNFLRENQVQFEVSPD